MFQVSSTERPGFDMVETEAESRRPFGRFQPPDPAVAEDRREPQWNGAETPQPFDSAKSFVGPHGTYYDERWRWMEWRGRDYSWNWAAALTFGGWFAYRKLYVIAALCVVWFGLLVFLAAHGLHFRLVALAQLAVAVTLGLYGNTLYRQRFRGAAWRVARDHQEHGTRLAALVQAGGVDPRAVWATVAALIATFALVLWLGAPADGIRLVF